MDQLTGVRVARTHHSWLAWVMMGSRATVTELMRHETMRIFTRSYLRAGQCT